MLNCSPNILYFQCKNSTNSILYYLNDNICKKRYDIHSLSFDVNPAQIAWDDSACLVIFDAIDSTTLFTLSKQIKQYIRDSKSSRIWINANRGQMPLLMQSWSILCDFDVNNMINNKPLIMSCSTPPNRIVLSDFHNWNKAHENSTKSVLDYLDVNLKTKDVQYHDITYKFNINFFSKSSFLDTITANFPTSQFVQDTIIDFSLVSSNLKTQVLGKHIVAFDTISSTVDVAECLKIDIADNIHKSLVIVALEQTNGRGRGDNTWISNKGSLLMTILHQLPKQFSPTLIQHILALSCVTSIEKITKVPLKIKWPNDIYYNGLKIGGVLVKMYTKNDNKFMMTSVGLNINNPLPTICINDIAEEFNEYEYRIKLEIYIANILNTFEDYLLNGDFEQILCSYKKHWLHKNSEITVKAENGPLKGKITGIDKNGFLELNIDGKILSAHPDGNSLDMMRNLLIAKYN